MRPRTLAGDTHGFGYVTLSLADEKKLRRTAVVAVDDSGELHYWPWSNDGDNGRALDGRCHRLRAEG